MITTNCAFLENELMDVVRIFEKQPENISHEYRFESGIFYNTFVIDGKKYEFSDAFTPSGEIEYKRFERRFAKLGLYIILSDTYGEKMPWGALTGIRPTKLAYTELEAGRNYKDFFKKMRVSEENISLVEEILDVQKGIYERKDNNTDLFVSIPFCPSKCEYCSFITAPIGKTKNFLEPYLQSLIKEIRSSKDLIGNLRSIYVGGGTPLVLDVPDLERVLSALDEVRKDGVEYTVEAGRPDVFTEEKLRVLENHGVTRICINPQSFLDSTLEKIGRKHTSKDLYNAFELSKKFNFDVNADLIAGLADENAEDFAYSVNEAVRTGADNITVHCLCLKVGAKLKEECSRLENPVIEDMVSVSRKILRENGYKPYYMYRQKYQVGNNENIGWTKPNKSCVYNIDIMEEITDNLALGANAVSKRVFTAENRIERFGSQKDLKTYIEKVDATIEKRREFFGKKI